MRALDVAVLCLYLAGTVLLSTYFSRSQHNIRDYFITGRRMPWWAIMGSIVATETSTVTFIGIPGLAYGGDFTFLQLAIGYLIGRLVISVLFIPAYVRGELLTVYQLLGRRFGSGVRRLASSIFLVTRSLADGFRLFATGLVLAALLTGLRMEPAAGASVPWLDPQTSLLTASVIGLGLVTVIYTYLGGMSAVIWNDAIQLCIYLVGAILAAVILLDRIPGGWAEVVQVGSAAGKFRVIDLTWDITKDYTFWSGVLGGAFLTTATHGTDQLLVQRYLCSRSPRQAIKALLVSGVVVFAQFVLFLLIGVMLWVYYTGHATGAIGSFMLENQVQTDRVFPAFIASHLPAGVLGLVVAAIIAAAMSTLSSSLNSSSAASVADFYIPLTSRTGRRRSPAHDLKVSKWMTVVWGTVQVGVALVAIELSSRVVDEVLGIASFTNGVMLGIFLLGTLTRRVQQRATCVGIVAGALTMLVVRLYTGVSWQWYVLIGSGATFGIAWLASLLMVDPRHGEPDRPDSEASW